MNNAGMAVNGIAEGNSLQLAAQVLQIPLNVGFPDDLILVDTAPSPIELGDLKIRIVGPDGFGLADLQAEWQGWLDGDGAMHVYLLKLAHHGSDRNVTGTF